jgi:hypothetical protein
MVKNVKSDENEETAYEYQRVHVGFQSTSSCNIMMVNALNQCNLFTVKKQRSVNNNKREWSIEMNHARQLYLKTYYRIDCTDHLIKNCRIFYRTFKYWHSPKNHGLSMTIVTAYDMYREVCEGKLDPDWKVDAPVNFWKFREKLSTQMLQYTPSARLYPGDEGMRAATRQSVAQRTLAKKKVGRPSKTATGDGKEDADNVTLAQFRAAKKASNGRLCGDLNPLTSHLQYIEVHKHPRNCQVCGNKSYTYCTICKAYVHLKLTGKKDEIQYCYMNYHCDYFFGLARHDHKNVLQKTQWRPPTKTMIKKQQAHIKNLLADA